MIVFAKYPEVGQVKTRLAQAVGAPRACELYRRFVQAVLQRTRPGPEDSYEQWVHYTPPSQAQAMRAFLMDECRFHGLMAPQAEGDLGMRMRASFERSFAAGARRVLIIGSDAPLLDRARVLDAFDRLRSLPVVLGPADDGGYYLIGLSSLIPDLFQDIPWSTSRVYVRTLEKIERQGLSFASLPVDFDVDDLAALRRLRRVLGRLSSSQAFGLSALSDFLKEASL